MNRSQPYFSYVAAFVWMIVASTATGLAMGQSDNGQSTDRFQHLRHIVQANALDSGGSAPLHIKVSFQLYDLSGEPGKKGTIELWWAAPGNQKLVVKSPSYSASEDSKHAKKFERNRAGYLTDQLLAAIIHPVLADFVHAPYIPTELIYGSVTTPLTCIVKRPPTSPDVTSGMPRYCVDPKNDALVSETGEGELLIKRDGANQVSGVNTCKAVSISYLGKHAIDGTVEVLEAMPVPKASNVESPQSTESRVVDSSYLVGQRLSAKSPVYPQLARAAHLTGTVTLGAIITKEGTIRDLDVVASPNPLLSKSATDAVQTWVYKPYLQNGSPTDVITSIFVHYEMEP